MSTREIYIITEDNRCETAQYVLSRERKLLNTYNADAITSNLYGVDLNKKFSRDRLEIVLDKERMEKIISDDLAIIRGRIEAIVKEPEYSDKFIKLLTVICKQGRVLILSEISDGLTEKELEIIIDIISEVEHTFELIILSTDDEYTVENFGNIVTKFTRVLSKPKAININKREAIETLNRNYWDD